VWIKTVPGKAVDQWVEEGVGMDVGDDTNQEGHQRFGSVGISDRDSQVPDNVIGVFALGSVELVSERQEPGCFACVREVK
jgi:hypothetical protein